LVGGAGNDTFTFATTGAGVADALAALDTITGGSGTDTLAITTVTTGLTGFTFANATGLEAITMTGDAAVGSAGGNLILGDGVFATVVGATVNASGITAGGVFINASGELLSTLLMTGSAVADSFIGGEKADTINGGVGADTITGGLGADSLSGGVDGDIFVYTLVTQSNSSNTDTITDFTVGADKLNITLDYNGQSTALDINATVQTARAGTALIQDNLSGARGQATYDTTGSALYINVNNDNLLTTADYKININAASTAANSIVEGDINFVITGGTNADVITTGGGADTITGNGGGDSITAGAGADTITVAAAGADTIIGGQGIDTINLTGAGAADVIRFASGSGTAGTAAAATSLGVDVITNLTGGTDIFNFSEAVFGNLNGAAGVASLDQTQVILLANTTTAMNTADSQIDGNGALTLTNGAFAVVGTNAAGNTVGLYFITSGATAGNTITQGIAAGTVVQIATVGVIGAALRLDEFVGVA
jgi:Ca2+-binding RTX toxin-like protein